MTTTVVKTMKGKIMETVFDGFSEIVNIRHFKARLPNMSDYSAQNKYTYDITIRHPEGEDPMNLLEIAIKAARKEVSNG